MTPRNLISVSPWLDRVKEIHRHIGIEPFIPYNAAQEKQPITPSVYSRAKNTDESSWRSAMSSHMERRRYPRVGCRLPVVSQPGSPALDGIVCDLSLDGLRLQTAQLVKAGAIDAVHLIRPSRSAPLHLEYKVVGAVCDVQGYDVIVH